MEKEILDRSGTRKKGVEFLALDPGKTCGYAYWNPQQNEPFEAWYSGQCYWYQVKTLLDGHTPKTLIIESFTLRKSPHTDLAPVEVIGIVKDWVFHQDKVTFSLIEQTPHQGKSFWSDDKLKKQNLYVPGKPHANDAMRHLLFYMLFGAKLEDQLPFPL